MTDASAPAPAEQATARNDAEPVKTTETTTDAPVAAAAAGAEPATAEKTASGPLQDLFAAAKAVGHPEIWGVTLADPETDVPSQIVFQKYLNANDGDVAKAKDQLTRTLEWRAQTKPLELLTKAFPKAKYDGVGYVTAYGDGSQAETKEVFTWNIYGIVKDMEKTFGDKDGFISWRVALMELALADLSIATATQPITADYDPYKIYQVHDYKSVSFFRQHPAVKAAVSETIRVFAQNYPELLKEKFFVNVPAIMGWMYALVKLVIAEKTAKKFHPMGNGANMSAEFAHSKVPGLGNHLPKAYGGEGEDLESQGRQTVLA